MRCRDWRTDSLCVNSSASRRWVWQCSSASSLLWWSPLSMEGELVKRRFPVGQTLQCVLAVTAIREPKSHKITKRENYISFNQDKYVDLPHVVYSIEFCCTRETYPLWNECDLGIALLSNSDSWHLRNLLVALNGRGNYNTNNETSVIMGYITQFGRTSFKDDWVNCADRERNIWKFFVLK